MLPVLLLGVEDVILLVNFYKNMNNKRFGALSSSENPEKLAATVKGLILAFSSLIILLGGHFGIPIVQEQIVEFATQIGIVAGGVWFLFGLVRKLVVMLSNKE